MAPVLHCNARARSIRVPLSTFDSHPAYGTATTAFRTRVVPSVLVTVANPSRSTNCLMAWRDIDAEAPTSRPALHNDASHADAGLIAWDVLVALTIRVWNGVRV